MERHAYVKGTVWGEKVPPQNGSNLSSSHFPSKSLSKCSRCTFLADPCGSPLNSSAEGSATCGIGVSAETKVASCLWMEGTVMEMY